MVAIAAAAASCGPNRSSPPAAAETAPERSITLDTREQGIIAEVNELRSEPFGYAARMEERRPYYRGNVLLLPGMPALRTTEGVRALEEAIRVLRQTKPLPPLTPSDALSRAARDHVRDIGPKGLVTHEGRDGSSPSERVRRYAARIGRAGEVISFGPENARAVVFDLIVDDGVPDRGHRKILLDGKFRLAGVACGPHATYHTACVIDLADRLEETGKPGSR